MTATGIPASRVSLAGPSPSPADDVTGAPVTMTTVTGAGGYYEFTSLLPGTYAVSETLQPGWAQTEPRASGHIHRCRTAVPAVGEQMSYDFGNCELVDLEGYKYLDDDADGSVDASDTGLAGWTITLTGTTGLGSPILMTTTTGAGGYYKFENLLPRYVRGRRDLAARLVPVVSCAPGARTGIAVESGDDTKGPYDFGNYEKTWLDGYKYHDTDGDGSISGEPGHRRLDDPPDRNHRQRRVS